MTKAIHISVCFVIDPHYFKLQPEVNQLQNRPDLNPQLRPEPMQLQPEVNEYWQKLQDCNPQLMPEPMQLQPEVNEWQNHQDCNPQLMPEPIQLRPEVNEWSEPMHNVTPCEYIGEMGPALGLSAKIVEVQIRLFICGLLILALLGQLAVA